MSGKEVDKSKLGKANKRMGCDAERHYAKIFRETFGYPLCKTSRLGSRMHDNVGIDLIFIPYNIQIKSGKQVGLNPSRELQSMRERMEVTFPKESPEFSFPKILIHKKRVEKGKKRTEFDELVYMSFSDFSKIVIKINTLQKAQDL